MESCALVETGNDERCSTSALELETLETRLTVESLSLKELLYAMDMTMTTSRLGLCPGKQTCIPCMSAWLTCYRHIIESACGEIFIHRLSHPGHAPTWSRVQCKVPSGASSRQASPRCEPHPSFMAVGILVRDPGLELLSEMEGLQMIKKCNTKLPIWSPRADTDFQGDCAICTIRRVIARLSDVGGQHRYIPWTNDDNGMLIVAFMSIDSNTVLVSPCSSSIIMGRG
ncbi:hypothetical protein FOTG_01700 [Fusarium oxysporum f. sp. vasinfectum 25433]|uniref:Uncharacterized protein n=1 Tax=Fusarium oxysporum f. sp. vasinfectum 25433 TaxID=1089449 RepID=X0MNH0_FUSOX|nr:hypothetical protein FOTG_01700 [Fusarium oxysporum f. sp. vasinfectum 25433]